MPEGIYGEASELDGPSVKLRVQRSPELRGAACGAAVVLAIWALSGAADGGGSDAAEDGAPPPPPAPPAPPPPVRVLFSGNSFTYGPPHRYADLRADGGPLNNLPRLFSLVSESLGVPVATHEDTIGGCSNYAHRPSACPLQSDPDKVAPGCERVVDRPISGDGDDVLGFPRVANDPRTGLSYSQLRQCAIPCARAAGPAPPAPGVDGRYFCKESASASSYYDRCDAEGGCVAPPICCDWATARTSNKYSDARGCTASDSSAAAGAGQCGDAAWPAVCAPPPPPAPPPADAEDGTCAQGISSSRGTYHPCPQQWLADFGEPFDFMVFQTHSALPGVQRGRELMMRPAAAEMAAQAAAQNATCNSATLSRFVAVCLANPKSITIAVVAYMTWSYPNGSGLDPATGRRSGCPGFSKAGCFPHGWDGTSLSVESGTQCDASDEWETVVGEPVRPTHPALRTRSRIV